MLFQKVEIPFSSSELRHIKRQMSQEIQIYENRNLMDPKQLLLYDPQYCRLAEKDNLITNFFNYAKFAFLMVIVLFVMFKFIVNFQADIKDENKRFYFFRLQRRNDCYLDYIANDCNQTTTSAQAGRCQELFKCYTTIDTNRSSISSIKYFWTLIDDFFYFLSKKSSIFLGILSGFVLFYTIK